MVSPTGLSGTAHEDSSMTSFPFLSGFPHLLWAILGITFKINNLNSISLSFCFWRNPALDNMFILMIKGNVWITFFSLYSSELSKCARVNIWSGKNNHQWEKLLLYHVAMNSPWFFLEEEKCTTQTNEYGYSWQEYKIYLGYLWLKWSFGRCIELKSWGKWEA